MEKREDYKYLPMADAMEVLNVKVNLFAVVLEIGSPTRSRGTDYFLTLRIGDHSFMAPGISVNFFDVNPIKLPQVKSYGDIIRLHRVMMKMFNGEVYCAFHKKISSFALYEGKGSTEFTPYQTSLKFHSVVHDEEFIKRLRTWSLGHEINVGASDYSLQIREIKIDQVFDLVCKVLHVRQTSESEWMIFVWDGTDAPSVCFETTLDSEKECPMPLHLEAVPLAKDVLRSFPRRGTVLRINIGKYFEEIWQLQGGTQWVKCRKIVCELQSGMWKGVLQTWSKIRFLSDEDDAVLLRQRNYKERLSSKLQHLPLASFPQPSHVTEVDYEDVAAVTLIDSLTHPEVTHKAKCIVRVVAAYPWRAENLISPVTGHYRIRLTLEDPTARIHAYICGEDGVKVFGGHPPAEELTIKMNKLLGIKECVGIAEGCNTCRDPPWVRVCLKSYYLDKNEPWGSRKYRIFSTKLVG